VHRSATIFPLPEQRQSDLLLCRAERADLGQPGRLVDRLKCRRRAKRLVCIDEDAARAEAAIDALEERAFRLIVQVVDGKCGHNRIRAWR
jgi:hypothetical protein